MGALGIRARSSRHMTRSNGSLPPAKMHRLNGLVHASIAVEEVRVGATVVKWLLFLRQYFLPVNVRDAHNKKLEFCTRVLFFEASLPAVGSVAGIRCKIFTATLAYAPRFGALATKFLTYHA